ncbi:unnamed protein product [Durusdinium trenchii]|uniref:C3H1-type domain-containing protein n=1 Tax=Durusdinium trenchii TaxID=1381693 RepID=A0ABP0HWE1_9DINO
MVHADEAGKMYSPCLDGNVDAQGAVTPDHSSKMILHQAKTENTLTKEGVVKPAACGAEAIAEDVDLAVLSLLKRLLDAPLSEASQESAPSSVRTDTDETGVLACQMAESSSESSECFASGTTATNGRMEEKSQQRSGAAVDPSASQRQAQGAAPPIQWPIEDLRPLPEWQVQQLNQGPGQQAPQAPRFPTLAQGEQYCRCHQDGRLCESKRPWVLCHHYADGTCNRGRGCGFCHEAPRRHGRGRAASRRGANGLHAELEVRIKITSSRRIEWQQFDGLPSWFCKLAMEVNVLLSFLSASNMGCRLSAFGAASFSPEEKDLGPLRLFMTFQPSSQRRIWAIALRKHLLRS